MNDKTRIANAVRRAKAVARIIGTSLLAYGLFLSAGHITEVGHAIGLAGHEAATLFVFVDILALYGKLLTSKLFVAKTRRIGYKLMSLGGALSLGCNVGAGLLHGNVGRAAYGAGIVAMIVLIEYATVNIKGKTVNLAERAPRKATAAVVTAQSNGKTWSPARRAAHEARKASPVSPGRPPVAAMSAAAMDAEFSD